jgi:hypothetical protein
VKPDPLDPANAEERESVVVLQSSEFTLDGEAATVQVAPLVALARNAQVALALSL